MPTPYDRLKAIASDIGKGVTPATVTVRDMLEWFGVSRRGSNVVRSIRGALERFGLDTIPDFEGAYVDGPIKFVVAGSDAGQVTSQATYRIGSLESANRKPVSVSPGSAIAEATTVMMAQDFSQLPVMTSEREVKGVITWRSIGCRLSLGKPSKLVGECMDAACLIDADASLFEAITIVAKKDYVLVRAADKVISGIVTASDLSQQFRDLAEPFLLLGEIEGLVRRLIHGKFSAEELQAAKDPADRDRKIAGVADLTFGEYVRLTEEPGRWKRLAIELDRKEFIARLKDVQTVRNDVMHFDPQGVDPTALRTLRNFVRLLQELRRHGAL